MESLPNSLLTEINAVSRMDALTLRARYGHFFGENSTRSTASLRSEIIYKLQERHYRKSVGTETAEILNDALEKREGIKKEREPHAAGAQYVRIWHGKKYVLVYRGGKQYEYEGQMYHSPSEVAKLITGSNWNGREFFHMPPLKESR